MQFKEGRLNQLVQYKTNEFGKIKDGEFKTRGKSYEFPHILPVEQKELNFMEPYRKDLHTYVQKNDIQLHRYFHHLNSSQALCLNFFYPLLAENLEHLLLQVLKIKNEAIKQSEFEKVFPEKKEGTNFDFYMQLQSGRQIFFEIKYTEESFGKISPANWYTDKYLQKYESIYKNMLKGKLRANINDYEELMKNYQLIRNISYIDTNRNDFLIIICPEHHVKLHKEYKYVLNNVIDPKLHKYIHCITWEELLMEIKEILANKQSSLHSYYLNLEEKYFN